MNLENELLSLCRALWRILRAKMGNLAILARQNKPMKAVNQNREAIVKEITLSFSKLRKQKQVQKISLL